VTALIGPEGGWSDAERAALEQAVAAGSVHRVRLTQTVLRIETACAAVAAIVMSSSAAPHD
jgi:RsmE family RNA methyltransferase